jgi:hypothetical protein
MSTPFAKALLGGAALVIAASFAVPARAQTVCAWPTMLGQCLPPPPGGSFIASPTGPWETRPYVPGDFSPDAESTVHSGPTH